MGTGSVPLDVLSQQVDRSIVSKRSYSGRHATALERSPPSTTFSLASDPVDDNHAIVFATLIVSTAAILLVASVADARVVRLRIERRELVLERPAVRRRGTLREAGRQSRFRPRPRPPAQRRHRRPEARAAERARRGRIERRLLPAEAGRPARAATAASSTRSATAAERRSSRRFRRPPARPIRRRRRSSATAR